MALSDAQQRIVDGWFPGAVVVADLSWGLVDTIVLHLRYDRGEAVVKAAGPGSAHIAREIVAHERWTEPWLSDGRVGRLLHSDPDHNMIALSYLPGVLVQGTLAAGEPDTYRQAGGLLAAYHRQATRVCHSYEAEMDARALRWLDGDHRIPAESETRLREVIAAHHLPPAELVPTHGDWQTRNWLVDGGRLLVIDLGRADWRVVARFERPDPLEAERCHRMQRTRVERRDGHPERDRCELSAAEGKPRRDDRTTEASSREFGSQSTAGVEG